MNIFGQYGPMCHRALFHSFKFISISMWIVNALHVISHWCCWIIIILSPFFRHENKMLSLKLSSDNLTIFFSYFGEMCRCMSKTMHTVTFLWISVQFCVNSKRRVFHKLHMISHWCYWIIITLFPFLDTFFKLSSDNLTIFYLFSGKIRYVTTYFVA